jgi:hypothetical protein
MGVVDAEVMLDVTGHTTGWYAKGKHTLEEMLEGIEYAVGKDYFEGGEKEDLKLFDGYMRLVPVGKYEEHNFYQHILFPVEKGRGAFECTVVYRE